MAEITEDIVASVKTYLGKDGISFFRACKEHHGRVDPVLMIYGSEDAKLSNETIKAMADPKRKVPKSKKPLPHPVHFREGMGIRNHLRASGLCGDWIGHDFDNYWAAVVEKAIA